LTWKSDNTVRHNSQLRKKIYEIRQSLISMKIYFKLDDKTKFKIESTNRV